MAKILITPRSLTKSGDPSLEKLRAAGYELVFSTPGATPGEDELVALVPGCVGWLVGVEPVGARVVAAMDAMRAVSRNGTGADNLPIAALEARGIKVLRAAGANARGVAELTIALMLGALRHVGLSDRALKDGGWQRRKGREIRDRTVGLVGCGTIGRMVAEVVLAMGARVVAHDPVAGGTFGLGDAFAWTDRDAVLANADIVSLHCPALPGGKALIDAGAIAGMREGALLVNTARASLIDEAAVLAALESGALGGYATDVHDPEPPGRTPLLAHSAVFATAHVGGFTDESVARAAGDAVDNLLATLGPAR